MTIQGACPAVTPPAILALGTGLLYVARQGRHSLLVLGAQSPGQPVPGMG
jgi:hypothetical protein